MVFKYTKFDESKMTQVTLTHNPPIDPNSLKAFQSLTDDMDSWVTFEDWERKMNELGIELRDVNGIIHIGYTHYTHRFRTKYDDGVKYIGKPNIGEK